MVNSLGLVKSNMYLFKFAWTNLSALKGVCFDFSQALHLFKFTFIIVLLHPHTHRILGSRIILIINFSFFYYYSYIIAIYSGHVEVEFPFTFLTLVYIPESCIFFQALNIVSFLVILTVYVRYKQIEQYYRDILYPESARIMKVNWIALCVGSASAFGLSIVANFQETNVFRVHMVGAMMDLV